MFQPVKNEKLDSLFTHVQFYRLFKRYGHLVDVAGDRFPHMARATMIISAYEASCQVEDIQGTIGHSSITTIEGYNHTT